MINYTNPNQACGRCHGNPPTTGSAASTHSGYVGQPTTSCSTCHGTVVNSSGQIINKNLHINGVVNANGSGHEYGFGGSKHRPGGTGTIQANSAAPFSNCGCHMVNAAALVGYSAVRHKGLSQGTCTKCHSTNTANFLGASPGCGDCHGTNANGGQPNGVATASAFPNWSGSHTAHVVQQSMTCADCHSGAGTGTPTHGNYSGILKTRANVSVAFNTAKSGPAVWSAGAMTCSSSFCHGQKSPAWGQNVASLKCQYCHGSQTLAYAGYTQATIAPGTNNIDTNRVTGVTPRGGMHTQHLEGTTGFSRRVRCQDCHVTVTPATLATHLNMTTATITFPANPDSVSRGTWNDSPGVTRPTATGLINCGNTACHTGKTNTGTAPTPVWNDTTYLTATAPSATLTVADCTKCHALPPTPGSGAHASVATVGSFPLNSACGSNCHGMTTSATTFGTIFPNKDLHINGKIEGGSDCLGCHNSPQGIRPAIGGEFAQKSHHVQGRAVTNNDCFMCHMEAADATGTPSSFHTGAPGGPVDLIVFTGAAGTGTRGTYTYVTYTANGKRHQIRKLNDHCLGCHNVTNNSTAVYVAGSTPGKYSPEQYLKTPVAKTPILSRYSSTRLVAWSQYKYSTATGGVNRFGTNNKAQITKALSAHGNAVKNQFPQFDKVRGDDSWLNVDSSNGALGANRNVLCYDCHNSHGSPVAGITTSYSSATGRNKGGLLKTTVAGERGYSVTYTPASRTIAYKNYSRTSTTTTSALFNSGASICNDCHNNDTSKVNISRPWSITATYSSLKPIVGYWSTPYFDNYTMMSALRTTYKQGGAVNGLKDLRKPMGGHYGSSVNGTQAGHDKEVNGLCTPCHDPHGVSNALGADRDHGVPLLKGTWVTSPYREDRADTIVKRGGGSNWTGMNSMGAVPGYHIDQNTFLTAGTATGLKNAGAATATSKSNLRSQRFRSFSNLSSAKTATGYPNLTVATFGGLCMECHNQTTLTGSASAPAAASAWMTQQRVHQSVAGWAATASGTDNLNNRRHAYTCSKCHTPHVSRLPRLLVTNCLDARHAGKVATGGLKDGMISTATATTNTFGNINQSLASSARGGGRFPGGGSRYSGTPGSAQNSGGWWFQTNGAAGTTQPGTLNATVNYGGTQCHNSATAGGATWSPANQMWNKKSRW
jgi:predicted CxxxxCH...CXXCH cytochrome family protein